MNKWRYVYIIFTWRHGGHICVQNNESAAVFVYKKHPVGIELFSQVKNLFYSKAADHVTENHLRYILFTTFSKLYGCFSYQEKSSGLLWAK